MTQNLSSWHSCADSGEAVNYLSGMIHSETARNIVSLARYAAARGHYSAVATKTLEGREVWVFYQAQKWLIGS